MILGIDPGLSGGIVLIDSSGAIEDKRVMPLNSDGEICGNTLTELILADFYPEWIFLEKVNAMPKQGVVSMFNFGTGFGIIRGVLAGLGHKNVVLVRPQVWQKEMYKNVSRPKNRKEWDTKEASRAVCREIWPNVDFRKSSRSRKEHSGICDAALIAEFGRRTVFRI